MSEQIKGPERVWVRVTRVNAAGEVVDQVNAAGDWQKHATQIRDHWIDGTWREYVRADEAEPDGVEPYPAPTDDLPSGWRWEWREADIPFGEDGDVAWYPVRDSPFAMAQNAACAWRMAARDMIADADLIDEDPPQAADLDLVPVVLADRRRPLAPKTRTVLADHETAEAIRGSYIGGACLDGVDWSLVIACLEDAIRRARKAAKGPDGNPIASLMADRIREQMQRIESATSEEVPF